MSIHPVSERISPAADVPTRPVAPGVHLHALTLDGTVETILARLEAGRGGWVVTINADILRRMMREPAFAARCAEADLRVADGMPLLWAARWRGTPLPGRVAGSDLIWRLPEAAATAGRSIYLVGGEPGTAEGAARILADRYPGLRVAGTRCPPMGFDATPEGLEREVRAVVDARPDIVFVAMGCPRQERFIERAMPMLPGTWWLGVGISFSFVCGRVRRAPRWVQRLGLEWAHRLWQEPGRLWRRYVVDDLPFVGWLLWSAGASRVSPWRRASRSSRER